MSTDIGSSGPSDSAQRSSEAAPAGFRPIYAWWTVGVLMVLQTLSLLDRHIMSLMIIEVRADLGLNDFQVSLLQGLAFTASYCIACFLMGRLVDTYSARRIIFFSVMVWSFASTACGMAKSYWGMMTARVFTGIGEGGVSPAGQVLISTLFPKNRVSFPMSLFILSGALGIGLSFFGGGLLLQEFAARPFPGLENFAPWRQVLIVTGVPGLLLAFLAFTLLERRTLSASSSPMGESWREVGRLVASDWNMFGRLFLAYGLNSLVCYAVLSWAPTYGRRVLELSPAEVGLQLGLISSFGGILAAGLQGYIIDKQFARGRVDFALTLTVWGACLTIPICVAAFTLDHHGLFIAAFIVLQCTISAANGAGYALFQTATPVEMRGRMASVMLTIINFCGYALGPMVIGALTEFAFVDPQKVGYSIALTIAVFGPISVWALWTARPYFRARLAKMATP